MIEEVPTLALRDAAGVGVEGRQLQVAAAACKLGAVQAFEALEVAIAFPVDARSRVEREAFILVIKDEVHRPCDCVRAIDRGPAVEAMSTDLINAAGMMLTSTCVPAAAGPNSEDRFELTTRRPLIKVSVRFEPRPKLLMKFTP